MFSDIYWITNNSINTRQIGTMARPRGGDWLNDEIKGLKIRKIDYLVSLLEYAEINELGLQEEESCCQQWGIQFINFPIEDVNVPKRVPPFISLVNKLAEQIALGKKVVIHCRMGIGRSSILAAAILIRLGYPSEESFELITQCRGLKVPDTVAQKDWIFSIAPQLKANS